MTDKEVSQGADPMIPAKTDAGFTERFAPASPFAKTPAGVIVRADKPPRHRRARDHPDAS